MCSICIPDKKNNRNFTKTQNNQKMTADTPHSTPAKIIIFRNKYPHNHKNPPQLFGSMYILSSEDVTRLLASEISGKKLTGNENMVIPRKYSERWRDFRHAHNESRQDDEILFAASHCASAIVISCNVTT